MFKVVFVTDSWACGERQFNTLAAAKWFEKRLLSKHAGISTSIIAVHHSAHVAEYKLHLRALASKCKPEHQWALWCE